jgi:hypothetical protein
MLNLTSLQEHQSAGYRATRYIIAVQGLVFDIKIAFKGLEGIGNGE